MHIRAYVKESYIIPEFIIIGIPSVKRQKGTYLTDTVHNLLANAFPSHRRVLRLLVFLCDVDQAYNAQVQHQLQAKFSKQVRSGLLEVIQASPRCYPRLRDLRQRFNDTSARVTWRSKQAVDFALMFNYASTKSQYYIQLEDDVISVPGYIEHIKATLNTTTDVDWGVLSFSSLGFIGKLFRGSALRELGAFFRLFYAEMPVDWLIYHYLHVKGLRLVEAERHIFHHVGTYSSLDNKKQLAVDKEFPIEFMKAKTSPAAPVQANSTNPRARLRTSMGDLNVYHTVDMFYHTSAGWYWAERVTQHSSIVILFHKYQRVRQVRVETGSSEHPGDYLHSGKLQAGSRAQIVVGSQGKTANKFGCLNDVELGVFDSNGSINVHLNDVRMACMSIASLEDHQNWVIFRTIHIDSKSENVVLNPNIKLRSNVNLEVKDTIKKQILLA